MIQHSENLTELAGALNKAQATMRNALTVGINPHFKSRYATLESVWEACRGPLTENGLSVVQLPGFEDGRATLDTMLLHTSGQWIRATAGTPIAKQDPQGVGSAITYLRRYALMAVASISPEDDDGNGATKVKERGGTSPASGRGRAGPSPEGGAARTAQPPAAPTTPPAVAAESLSDAPRAFKDDDAIGFTAGDRIWIGHDKKESKLKDMDSPQLVTVRKWIERTGKREEFLPWIEEVLAGREGL